MNAKIHLADRGINPKMVIDGAYTSKYNLADLLESYHQAKIKESGVVDFDDLLFAIYAKGCRNEDCDLTDYERQIKKALKLIK